MALAVPASVNYPNPSVMIPDVWMRKDPPEGPQMIPCEVLWGVMGGSAKCVSFNMQNGGNGSVNQFSQVAALSIDNSKCGASVVFIFSDTQETITIPAYSPKVIVPVFSRSVTFFLSAQGQTLSADVTRFIVHNTLPPPLAVPTSQEQSLAAVSGQLCVDGAQVYPVLAAGNSGTLELGCAMMSSSNVGGGSWAAKFELKDGDGKLIGSWSWAAFPGGDPTFNPDFCAMAWNVQAAHVRFNDGLSIMQTMLSGTMAVDSTYLNLNAYYRTP